MANKEERMDVALVAIYLNSEQPAEWDKPFPWKPSVSIQFKRINQRFQESGETLKARANGADSLWMYEAMGGKNAKGHFFDLMTESGETNGNAWTSFTPLGELFKDGTQKRILPPDGSAAPAEPQQPTGPAAGSKAPAGPAAPAVKTTPAKPVNGKLKLDPKYGEKAAAFLNKLTETNSDAWWTYKRHLDLDGADASNVLDMAKHLALMEVSKTVYEGEDPTAAMRKEVKEAIDFWAAHLSDTLRSMKNLNVRTRITHLVGLCQTPDHIAAVIHKAYSELPQTDYEMVREVAEKRLDEIKTGTVKVSGTLQPEVLKGEANGEEDIPF